MGKIKILAVGALSDDYREIDSDYTIAVEGDGNLTFQNSDGSHTLDCTIEKGVMKIGKPLREEIEFRVFVKFNGDKKRATYERIDTSKPIIVEVPEESSCLLDIGIYQKGGVNSKLQDDLLTKLYSILGKNKKLVKPFLAAIHTSENELEPTEEAKRYKWI